MRRPSTRSERSRVTIGMVTHRVLLFVAVVLACGFLLLDRAELTVFDNVRDGVADAMSPVLEVISGPVAAVRDFLSDIQGYLAVHEENARLREENAELLASQAQLRDLRRRNERLAAILNLQLDPSIGYTTGRVVADDGGPFRRTLIVNAGSAAGVERGQAVVDQYGLVGRVIGTGGEASRILLVTDLNSHIPVFIQPGRRRAILSGDNSDLLRLDYLEGEEPLMVGAEVVTTGEGGLIPPGLPVGVVRGQLGDTWRVQSRTSFDAIDFVRVLNYEFPRDVEIPPPGVPPLVAGEEEADAEAEAADEEEPNETASEPDPATGGED